MRTRAKDHIGLHNLMSQTEPKLEPESQHVPDPRRGVAQIRRDAQPEKGNTPHIFQLVVLASLQVKFSPHRVIEARGNNGNIMTTSNQFLGHLIMACAPGLFWRHSIVIYNPDLQTISPFSLATMRFPAPPVP